MVVYIRLVFRLVGEDHHNALQEVRIRPGLRSEVDKPHPTLEGLLQGQVYAGQDVQASSATPEKGVVWSWGNLGDQHGPNPALEASEGMKVKASLFEPEQIHHLVAVGGDVPFGGSTGMPFDWPPSGIIVQRWQKALAS